MVIVSRIITPDVKASNYAFCVIIRLMSESLALISDTKLKASNPVAAEDREKDKGKGCVHI